MVKTKTLTFVWGKLHVDAQDTELTDAEEQQGLHAEELFVSDLQQQQLLGEMSHPYAVLIHAGSVHPIPAGVKSSG